MNEEWVILSTKLVIGEGLFCVQSIDLEKALKWVQRHSPNIKNFCGHPTARLLGLEPTTTREQCTGYTEALCLSAKGRLDFGREYTVEEIMEVGVDFTLITFTTESRILANVGNITDSAWRAGLENYPYTNVKTIKELLW